MSLQTTHDIVKNSYLKCCHIDFIEFLEMIGRVADVAFQSDEPLYLKINRVLDEWLPYCG